LDWFDLEFGQIGFELFWCFYLTSLDEITASQNLHTAIGGDVNKIEQNSDYSK